MVIGAMYEGKMSDASEYYDVSHYMYLRCLGVCVLGGYHEARYMYLITIHGPQKRHHLV